MPDQQSTMTTTEILAEMNTDTPLNRARREFRSACGRIEQAYQQRRPPSPIEVRRMEFDAVRRIAVELGVTLP